MPRFVSVRGFAQLLVVALPVALGLLVMRRAVDVPYWDEWDLSILIYKMHMGALQFGDIWAQHNEHRIFFPTLIALGLDRFGGWDPVREQFVSLAVLLLTQLGVLALMRRTAAAGAVAIYAGLGASMLLYGLWQWENLNWGFQLAWFMCNACAVLVAVLLSRPFRRPVHVVYALALAVIGSYSSSQGLIVWAVGAVAIALGRRDYQRTLAVWLSAALVTYYGYRHGLVSLDNGHFSLVGHPIVALRYILAYLGSPLAGWLGDNGSACAGLMVIALLAASFAADLRSPFATRRLKRNAGWYAIAVYPLLCAVATCIGRAGFGIDQALSSRYTTIGLLAWVALIGLGAARLSHMRVLVSSRWGEGVLVGGMMFGLLVGASDVVSWGQWKATADTLRLARTELEQNDPAALARLFPDRNALIARIGLMRSIHDGIFTGR